MKTHQMRPNGKKNVKICKTGQRNMEKHQLRTKGKKKVKTYKLG